MRALLLAGLFVAAVAWAGTPNCRFNYGNDANKNENWTKVDQLMAGAIGAGCTTSTTTTAAPTTTTSTTAVTTTTVSTTTTTT